jgi:hypothetical protein
MKKVLCDKKKLEKKVFEVSYVRNNRFPFNSEWVRLFSNWSNLLSNPNVIWDVWRIIDNDVDGNSTFSDRFAINLMEMRIDGIDGIDALMKIYRGVFCGALVLALLNVWILNWLFLHFSNFMETIFYTQNLRCVLVAH